MLAHTNFKIHGIVEEIKKTHAILHFHEQGKDPADTILAEQFRIRKIKLFKELLAELVLSGITFKSMAPVIRRFTAYLEKSDVRGDFPKEIKSNLAEVEMLMPA